MHAAPSLLLHSAGVISKYKLQLICWAQEVSEQQRDSSPRKPAVEAPPAASSAVPRPACLMLRPSIHDARPHCSLPLPGSAVSRAGISTSGKEVDVPARHPTKMSGFRHMTQHAQVELPHMNALQQPLISWMQDVKITSPGGLWRSSLSLCLLSSCRQCTWLSAFRKNRLAPAILTTGRADDLPCAFAQCRPRKGVHVLRVGILPQADG